MAVSHYDVSMRSWNNDHYSPFHQITMTNQHIQQAIEKAIEGGYIPKRGDTRTIKVTDKGFEEKCDIDSILLDPLFWQALFKEYIPGRSFKISERTIPQWKSEWYYFIYHISEGKNVESFFKQLLS